MGPCYMLNRINIFLTCTAVKFNTIFFVKSIEFLQYNLVFSKALIKSSIPNKIVEYIWYVII